MADQTSTYDGFISYSHAADGLLAPRLQSALQRFAKPWWKRRAVRIFRDESSLSANPHLWSSITEALDTSGWFVLLLSPDAAQSEWVNQEIAYWVGNRDPRKMLPVVTDGTFGWDGSDVAGDSVPAALRGVFNEEPRWVDVRWARDEEQLSLQDPRFADAVADIGSTIRGIPKDDLASEEVRQHRRTVRTAWAAGGLVAIFAVAAVGFGIQSARNADVADANAQIAAQEAERANDEAERANDQAERANRLAEDEAAARAEAEVNAALATSRELAAAAVVALDADPELATLLAIEAIDSAPEGVERPASVTQALWRAGQANRRIGTIDTGFGGVVHAAVSADGSRIAISSESGEGVRMYDQSGALVWEHHEPTSDSYTFISMTADAKYVAVSVTDSTAQTVFRQSEAPDDLPNRTLVLDGVSGELVQTFEWPDCAGVEGNGWSPDGRFLVITSGYAPCERFGESVWFEVYRAGSWESVRFVPTPDFREGGPLPAFDESGRLFMYAPGGVTQIYSTEGYVLEGEIEHDGVAGVTASGDRVLIVNGFDSVLWDTEEDALVDRFERLRANVAVPLGVGIDPSGTFAAIGTFGRETEVFDLNSGARAFTFGAGPVTNVAFDGSGETLYLAHKDGTVTMWDLTSRAVGVQSAGDLGRYHWVNGNSFSVGPEFGGAVVIDFEGPPWGTWAFKLFDVQTGELTDTEFSAFEGLALADGRFVVNLTNGSLILVDPVDGSTRLLDGCGTAISDECPSLSNVENPYNTARSADGRQVMAFGFDLFESTREILRFDIENNSVERIESPTWPAGTFGTEIITFQDDWVLARVNEQLRAADLATGEVRWSGPIDRNQIELAPDGSFLAMMSTSAEVVLVETGTWAERRLPVVVSGVRGMAFSPDAKRLALGTASEVQIVDLDQQVVAQVLNLGGVSDFHWLSDDRLVVGTNTGLWGTLSLDTEAFLAQTRQSLRRGFTASECDTFQISPCPSMEELQGG